MANRKKNVSVSFRVTPEAADVIHQKATESGLTLSEYLTGCALGKEIVNLTELAAFTKEVEQLRGGGLYEYEIERKRFIMYLDESLKSKEERDYLQRLEEKKEDYSDEGFLGRQYHFGTITFHTNLTADPKEIYTLYKTRNTVEQTFDFLKNLLEQDHTYLQSQQSVESWAFINHISMMLVYRLFNLIKSAGLTASVSVQDLISHLKYIQRIKINNSWVTGEISGKTQKLLDKLNVHIT